MSTAKVTILIPHYKTLTLTKLCLRLLCLHTDLDQIRVIVIDNGSNDESTQYLKTLSWIQLIIRDPGDDKPWVAHGKALNEAFELTNTPYVLSFHTDTLVKKKGWLDFLLSQIDGKPKVAGAGSWKLESKPCHKRLAKAIERWFQLGYYRLTGKKNHRIVGTGNNHYYLRSHCALYRTDLLREYGLDFTATEGTIGKKIHKDLVAKGHEMRFISSERLSPYMDHLNHATMVLNPGENAMKKGDVDKGLKRIKKGLAALNADKVLADDSLDR